MSNKQKTSINNQELLIKWGEFGDFRINLEP
jgi:hypothetical protein